MIDFFASMQVNEILFNVLLIFKSVQKIYLITIRILKIIINIVLAILIILLVANGLFWFLAIGSGHNIPKSTNYGLAKSFIILVILIVIIYLLKNRITKKPQ